MGFKKDNLEPEEQGHGSDMPTSPMAILHHTDQFYVLFCTRL